jgi:hypothetical protein
MAGQAQRRAAKTRVTSDNEEPTPQGSAGWRPTRRRPARRPAALGAGITATVLAGAMMAVGPAAAAGASPAANAATARGVTVSPTARLARGVLPWARSAARHAITPQARAAAAASSLGFSGADLFGVSCTGKAQCTATGMASTRSGKNLKTVAERWNGSNWVLQPTPTPTYGSLLGGALDGGVDCTSSTACRTAGYSYSNKSDQLLGEGWNGTKWTSQPDAKPLVAGEPYSISCRWAKDCMAVGSRDSGMTLAEHWNGRKWSAIATKHAGGLAGISCPATGNCTAIGTNGTGKALAEHWNGKTWSDQSAASPQQLNILNGVSCAAVKDCVAVGTAGTPTSTSLPLTPIAEQWTGGKWLPLTVPDTAPSTDYVELNSVSCTSTTNCMAVGDDYAGTTGTADGTLAEQWNGTTWTVVTTPSPDTFSALLSVSCSSATHCVAVGASAATATGTVSPLTEVWNGSTWTAVTAPR